MTDTGLPARRAALTILSGVLQKRRPLDAGLDQLAGLSTRDAGFARALVSQSLRHMGALDAVLRKFIAKPLVPHKAGAASEILLLGACELLILKVAAHAAVDAANDLAAKDSKAVHFKPLINAVLRKVAKEGEAVLSGLDRERLSTPDWLWTRWVAQYDAGTARVIARAHQHEAPIDIVMKSPDAVFPPSEALFGNARRLTDPGRIDWWVQDCAATLPATLLGDVRGRCVIDLCAAPGGKTMQLAAAGANVIAVEIDPLRAERIKENLARIKLSADVTVGDARDFETTAPFVLIDAPCTATGTIPTCPGSRARPTSPSRRARRMRFWRAARPWSSRAAFWFSPSVRWNAKRAKSRSPRFSVPIGNFHGCPLRRMMCSVMASGSRRMATCAPCLAISATRAAWTDFSRRG
jgi:16S rRNA (cytosine967-C5)-methyltransferase